MNKLKIRKFVFNPFLENTYLVWEETSKEAAVIDPGVYDDKEKELFKNFIDSHQIELRYLINTHCHIDHILGNSFIKDNFNTDFLAPEEDMEIMDLMVEQAKNYGVTYLPSPEPDRFINEESVIKLGSVEGRFIFTPGHTPGEYCLYFESEKICFTGDVLFKSSIGRTDLWGGDYKTLIKSIKEELLVLPDNVVIYPGHDSESTIGFEKRNNPFLNNVF